MSPGAIVVSIVVGLFTVSVVAVRAQVASAATDIVTTCAGAGPGSLPVVVASAGSGDIVTFDVSCPPSSPIVLATTIIFATNLTVEGPGGWQPGGERQHR